MNSVFACMATLFVGVSGGGGDGGGGGQGVRLGKRERESGRVSLLVGV